MACDPLKHDPLAHPDGSKLNFAEIRGPGVSANEPPDKVVRICRKCRLLYYENVIRPMTS